MNWRYCDVVDLMVVLVLPYCCVFISFVCCEYTHTVHCTLDVRFIFVLFCSWTFFASVCCHCCSYCCFSTLVSRIQCVLYVHEKKAHNIPSCYEFCHEMFILSRQMAMIWYNHSVLPQSFDSVFTMNECILIWARDDDVYVICMLAAPLLFVLWPPLPPPPPSPLLL